MGGNRRVVVGNLREGKRGGRKGGDRERTRRGSTKGYGAVVRVSSERRREAKAKQGDEEGCQRFIEVVVGRGGEERTMPSSCWNLSEFCILFECCVVVWKRRRFVECAVRGGKKERERDEAVFAGS